MAPGPSAPPQIHHTALASAAACLVHLSAASLADERGLRRDIAVIKAEQLRRPLPVVVVRDGVSAPPPRAVPTLPAIGETFTGKVLDLDDEVVMVAVPGFGDEQAVGAIRAPIDARPKYRVGNAARVDVTGVRTLKSGRTVVKLKPAPKQA